MDDTTDVADPDTSLAKNRSRRTKKDKTGRLAALDKLKKAKEKGEKWKYEVEDEGNVYEEVDEETYSKIVQERQEDDWIVDDDGSGYVEDGREIFDDEDGDAPVAKGKKNEGKGKKRQNPNIRAPDSKPKNIRSMFAAAAVKTKPKAKKDVNLNDDELLGDIMAELQQEPAAAVNLIPPAVRVKKKQKAAINPFATKTVLKPPPQQVAKPLATRNVPEEPEEEPAPPPVKMKKPLPKPVMRTALDKLEDSPEIDDFSTQEINNENELNAENHIESQASVTDTAMDVTDIDFDDDMSESSQQTKKPVNGHSKTNGEMEEEDDKVDVSSIQWEVSKGDDSDIPVDVQVDSSQLPLVSIKEGEQFLRMYWIDAYEDQYRQPGIVYLFGKVWIESAKTHVSCCVAVRNIERKIFVLPRRTKYNTKAKMETEEPVTFLNVYTEFNEGVAERYKITKFKSRKVTKEYAFEMEDVPAESDYLEVRYSADLPQLPKDLEGETFSHIFGTNTSSLEIFLMERKLKGPSWIDIKMPQLPNPAVSWCKVEAFVNTPNYITLTSSPPSAPPLVIMTFNLRTFTNPKTHQNEVIGASCLVHHKFQVDKPAPEPQYQQHFCAISKPNDCVFPYDFRERVQKQNGMKLEIMGTERALLGFMLAKIHKVDPDVIVGHDVFGFDLDVFLHRIDQNKVPHWSRIGRLKRSQIPKVTGHRGKGGVGASAASGRLVCDVKISAKELIRCRSYDLTELVSHVLKKKRTEIDPDMIRGYFNSSNHLLHMMDLTLRDSSYTLSLLYELMVLPLAMQITNICGNVMARTLLGGRSERNEYLLLHAFTERNFIVPDKSYGKKPVATEADDDEGGEGAPSKKSGRRKPAYAGGLVLEPKKGFYDKFILLLDFNSLYPSIIQEYNICFTTVSRESNSKPTQNEDGEELLIDLPDQDLEPGVLPTEIRKLVQSRKQVKGLMKDPNLSKEAYMQYDIRQKALKLTANSMYGCLGFTFSRFFAKPLAALVTGKGREILMKTKDLAQNMNLDVIYGDTDSIMINTNSTDMDQVFKLGHKIKGEVNKLYKLLEIDIDGVFKSLLLLKKKKYAAVTISKVGDKIVTAQELKGLDIVRRDWCELAKEAGNFVVSQILSGENRETIVETIHAKLQEVGQKVKDGEIPVELYQITKQLTKNPEDYPDKKSLPHVQVALRLNSKGGRKLRAGDIVYYVVCEDGSNLSPSQRAYHPDELTKSETLKIDTKYYLTNQVHPVVSRLCDPIDGTDTAHIAECLGLDPSGFRQSMAMREAEEEDGLLGGNQVSDEERYKDCDRLKFNCPTCSKEIIFDSVFTGAGVSIECSLAKCTNPQCKSAPYEYVEHLMNRITIVVRSHIKKYYQGMLKCDDSACGAETRKLPLMFFRGHPVCHACQRGTMTVQYTDSTLYTQLCFYQYMFDLDRALENITDTTEKDVARRMSKEYKDMYKSVKSHIDKVIKHSAYSEVNLARLFKGLFSLKG